MCVQACVQECVCLSLLSVTVGSKGHGGGARGGVTFNDSTSRAYRAWILRENPTLGRVTPSTPHGGIGVTPAAEAGSDVAFGVHHRKPQARRYSNTPLIVPRGSGSAA